MKRTHCAFTLIELLVVIAILGILVALIFPVISKSIDAANTVKCLTNLRQIGVAVPLYAADNDGRIPIAYDGRIGSKEKLTAWSALDAGGYINNSSGLLECPGRTTHSKNYPYTYLRDRQRDYVWTKRTGYVSGSSVWQPDMVERRMSNLAHPSVDILVWCESWPASANGYVAGFADLYERSVLSSIDYPPRHGDRRNFLFVDGHAGTFTEAQYKEQLSSKSPANDPAAKADWRQ